MDGGERQGRAKTFALPPRLPSSAFMIGLKVGGKVFEARLPFYVAALWGGLPTPSAPHVGRLPGRLPAASVDDRPVSTPKTGLHCCSMV